MKHEDKIKFMQEWCQKQNLTLILEGEVGFGGCGRQNRLTKQPEGCFLL